MDTVEIEKILGDIKKAGDENLAKRLEPIELALSEKDTQLKDLTERFNKSEQSVEDMRKLIKATNERVYQHGEYKGNWPTAECARQFGHLVFRRLYTL